MNLRKNLFLKYTKAFVVLFFYVNSIHAQYTLNGSAFQNSCRCYTVTPNIATQKGSVWNNNRINLNQSFDFTFQVFLGCSDGNGADGMAFVLQPMGTSTLSSSPAGGGMAFFGLTPSLAVSLDTYQNIDVSNINDNDPTYDHIAIQLNGVTSHNSVNTITPNTRASATSDNIEDCLDHNLRIVWNATTKNMQVYFDGQSRLNVTNDFVNTTFGGNSLVYWGFTGATGGLSNVQKFCTELTPRFRLLPNQIKCVNQPVSFIDSTTSFAGIVKFYWNFGDGSPIDSVNQNPIHTYTVGGDYTITYTVFGFDGCSETYTQPLRIGSKPIAGFSYTASCQNSPVQLVDTSDVAVGTINNWYWDLDNNGQTSTSQFVLTTYSTPGIKNIKFVVKSAEGCVSDTLRTPITVSPRPTINFSFTDSVCLGTPTIFTDLSFVNGSATTPINYWQWFYGDSSAPAIIQNPTHVFTNPGNHSVSLITSASGTNACAGTAITKNVFVSDKPVAKIKSIILCERQQAQFQDSSYSADGLAITNCWWDFGNGQTSNQCNPNFTFTTPGPKTIKHVVFNSRGCKSDTLTVSLNVADKPLANFNFSQPICNDNSIQLTDITTVQNGSLNQWNWIYNSTTFSTTQNTIGFFPYGNVQVGLVATSNLGCFSDTVFHTFKLIKNPVVDMQFNDTCKNALVQITSGETTTSIGINQWQWNFGDGFQGTGSPVTHTYTNNGQYTITLYATSIEGCKDTAVESINIYGTNVFAGNDTIVVTNQPIQLNATGGFSYQWTPSIGLSSDNIPNPIAIVSSDQTYYVVAFTPTGCKSYDTIKIKVYDGVPQMFFPNAFTPNGDGLNDVFKPFPVGLKRFEYFAIYNRFGQQLFYSTKAYKGWNGEYKGIKQPAGTYVCIAKGIDYRNNALSVKRTILLIR